MDENHKTCAETEALLQAALDIKGRSISSVAAAIGLRPNTLYKWKGGSFSLSMRNMDRLFLYLKEYEPDRLARAYSNQS